jgi:hypothetical protein
MTDESNECVCGIDKSDPFHAVEHYMLLGPAKPSRCVHGMPACVHAGPIGGNDTFIVIEKGEPRRPLVLRICPECAKEVGALFTRICGLK